MTQTVGEICKHELVANYHFDATETLLYSINVIFTNSLMIDRVTSVVGLLAATAAAAGVSLGLVVFVH